MLQPHALAVGWCMALGRWLPLNSCLVAQGWLFEDSTVRLDRTYIALLVLLYYRMIQHFHHCLPVCLPMLHVQPCSADWHRPYRWASSSAMDFSQTFLQEWRLLASCCPSSLMIASCQWTVQQGCRATWLSHSRGYCRCRWNHSVRSSSTVLPNRCCYHSLVVLAVLPQIALAVVHLFLFVAPLPLSSLGWCAQLLQPWLRRVWLSLPDRHLPCRVPLSAEHSCISGRSVSLALFGKET